MKNVQITTAMIMVNFQLPIKVGSVSLTAGGVAHIYKSNQGRLDADIDWADSENITYMDMKVDGWKGYDKLISMHSEMGIDLNALIREEFDRIVEKEGVKESLIKQFGGDHLI